VLRRFDPQARNLAGPFHFKERQVTANKGHPSGSRSEQARERGNHSSQGNNSERTDHQVQGTSGDAQPGMQAKPSDEPGSASNDGAKGDDR
jgi:hypothetical protein